MNRVTGRRLPLLRSSPIALASTALAFIALFTPSCTALPAVRGYYTPGEVYRNAAALGGKTITVRGNIKIVSSFCTEVACPPDNPCCNSCYYHMAMPIDTNYSIWLTGENAGCRGNSCRADCRLPDEGHPYEITGALKPFTGPIVYLEMLEWKRIG